MEKILKYYRENLLFIFLMIVISVLFLADIGIIDTYSDDYYPPKQPDPPNFILEILIFLRNLSGLLMLRFLYNKRDNILDAFYNFYNQFDDPIDYDDILYMIEKNTITKEAGLYILNQRENYLNFLKYIFQRPFKKILRSIVRMNFPKL